VDVGNLRFAPRVCIAVIHWSSPQLASALFAFLVLPEQWASRRPGWRKLQLPPAGFDGPGASRHPSMCLPTVTVGSDSTWQL